MAITDAALQAAVDNLTTDRVVDIYQHLDETDDTADPDMRNAIYCVVRVNYNDATYALPSGKACWVEVTDTSDAATQAAELLAGLSSVGPLDPDTMTNAA